MTLVTCGMSCQMHDKDHTVHGALGCGQVFRLWTKRSLLAVGVCKFLDTNTGRHTYLHFFTMEP